ncbi:MAG: selenocysteine-specific translation elongation factor [Desulfobacterales bacterium]
MKKHISIGAAGHVDHGKTALVRCLTGIDTDRMKEEKNRGLSIEPGIARLVLPSGREVALVDVPGHTDFLKNTVRGLSAVDMAILVVAADDGVMPQTKEHLKILEFLNAKTGIAVLSKSDLVDRETLELAGLEIEEAAKGTFLEGKPVIPFSAVDESGKTDILNALDEQIADLPGKEENSPFRLRIDQARNFSGIGTVVSGTVLSGVLHKDDPLDLLPSGLKTRARSLEVHGRKTDTVYAGQRVGINLHRISLDEIRLGMMLSAPGKTASANLINVRLCMSEKIEPLKNRQKIRLFLGSCLTTATAVLMEKEPHAGEKALVQLRCDNPVACIPGERFAAALMNVPVIIGGGTVLEISECKFRPSKAAKILPWLWAVEKKDTAAILDAMPENVSPNPEELSWRTGLAVKDFDREIRSRIRKGKMIQINGSGIFRKEFYEKLQTGIPVLIRDTLKADPLKKNMNAAEIILKTGSDPSHAGLIRHILEQLSQKNLLIPDNGGYRIPDMMTDLSGKHSAIAKQLLNFARSAGVTPFTSHAAWQACQNQCSKNEVEKLLVYLARRQQLACLNNRRFLSLHGLEEIKQRVRTAIVQKGSIRLGDGTELLGYGRMGAVPVLEYLDEIGFTFRRGDERVLKET